jgi:hypothetical protein
LLGLIMTDPVFRITGALGSRGVARRPAAPDDGWPGDEEPAAAGPSVPAPASPPHDDEAPRSRRAAIAAFAAQLLGQGGQKRGLRGGPETLGKARAAYLETEWSGPFDRRVRRGRITKTEV